MSRIARTGQSLFQKGDEVCRFGVGQLEREEFLIELRMRRATLVVVYDDFFQSLDAAVVHVRCRTSDLTQRRSLERSFVSRRLVDRSTSLVCAGNSDVMETVVGETRAGMARAAVGLAHEQLHPACSRLGQRGLVARLELVVGSISRQHGSLVGGDGLGHAVRRDVAAEHLLKLFLVAFNRVELRDDGFDGHLHFDRILDRAHRLIFQILGTSIPELQLAVSRVDDGRRVAATLLAFDTRGELFAIAEALGRIMARSTRHLVVRRQSAIKEELLSQQDLLGRRRIILGMRHRRQAGWLGGGKAVGSHNGENRRSQ